MSAFQFEATDYIPDLARYNLNNLNKFSLKRFVEFADIRQLIVKEKKNGKNTRIIHPIYK